MKPRHLGRRLALFTSIVSCGAAAPAMSQSMFDIFFLSDTTGSMGGLINGVKASSTSLVDSFLSTGNDVTFGVGEYKDGNVDAFGFRYNLTAEGAPVFSTSSEAVSAAISQWTASGGGDFPEDNLLGLRSVADTAPWRDGSRRIIYIFGDAPSLVTGSDGTTLSDTLAALAANCVEVVFIDVGGMTSGAGQSQIDAILANELTCVDEAGQYVDLNLSGLSGEEAAARILETLTDNFTDIAGTSGGTVILSGNLGASIVMTRTMTRDVGGRLFRMRSGVQPEPMIMTQPAPPTHSAKGGLPKGGLPPQPMTSSYDPQWQVWGQLFYSDDSHDAQYQNLGTARRLLRAETDTEIFGGTIGIERRLDGGFTAGLALSLAEADVTMRNVANTDIDTWAVIPYLSYYRPDALHGADFYADALYAYSDHDYSVRRMNGARGSTDGSSHNLELNAGLNYRREGVVHGPFGQFRWLDGDIDAYTETGPGALTYADTSYKSVATQLGYQASFPVRVQGGILVPQLTAAWEHEFEPGYGSIGGVPLGEMDEDLAVLGAGVGLHMINGWNMLLNYEARLGSDTENHYVGFKVGREF